MGGYFKYDRMMELLELIRESEFVSLSYVQDEALEQAIVHLKQNKKNIEDEIARVAREARSRNISRRG